jgi:CRISPR-associated endoribonuclease Cas6
MNRIRIILPRGRAVYYQYNDILHDAVVNGLTANGAPAEAVIGPKAGLWHFAAMGWRNHSSCRIHTLVIGVADPVLSQALEKLHPEDIAYSRAQTGEVVDFSGAEIQPDPDPIAPGQHALGVVMLSPLAISRQNGKHHWHTRMTDVDLGAAISARLSRITGRPISIRADPDRLYLRTRPRHDTLVPLKGLKGGKRAFVIGMRAPLVLTGETEDLRLAWYGGIGEKNRAGFGCIGLAERGIGR